MTILPIFTRDMRSGRRSSKLRQDRLLAGGVGGVILLVLAGIDRWAEGVNLARFLKGIPVAGILPYLLLMVGVTIGVKLLSLERREGTLPLLLLTRLTGYDILFGKLLMALVVELNVFLAVVPALVLPMIVAGFKWSEIGLMMLACANVVFGGLALGMFAAVFVDEEKAVSWCLLLVLPFTVLATPFGALLPSGLLRDGLALLRPFNPGEALAHVQTIAGGFRRGAFWMPLLVSHLMAWALLGVGGLFLARASRLRSGRDAGPRRRRRRQLWRTRNRSVAFRRRLLDCNPFLWLTSRQQWPTVQTWIYLGMAVLLWGWFAWLTAIVRGINLTIIWVIALAASWIVQFIVTVPAEASRRLVEDRQSGALEMLLCTPLSVERIIWGQWLALGRRYLPPLILVMILSVAFMIAGYVTYGFGGMLDPADRAFWLFVWSAGLGLLPLALIALCWVAMQRALFARNVGDASGIAVLKVIGLPCFALPIISMLFHSLFGGTAEWRSSGSLFVIGFAVAQMGFAGRARAHLYRDLRKAAASRYFESPAGNEMRHKVKRWWIFRQQEEIIAS